MRFDPPVPVAAVRSWLPPSRDTAERAVAENRLTVKTAAKDGYTALSVGDLAPPQMAVRAAEDALAAARVAPSALGLAAHAWIHHQGHDFWSPAHYVAHGLGARHAVPLGIQQMCNGGAAAVELAAVRMLADPGLRYALVTTADRFAAPGFDRWQGDYGVAYGDGATALLLGRAPARYALLGAATVSAPDLEEMHRGGDPFSPAPRGHGTVVDVRRTKKAFFDVRGMDAFTTAANEAVRAVLAEGLALAGGPGEVECVALPRLGRAVLDTAYLPAVRAAARVRVLDFGRDTGHLGAGDAVANLARIDTDGLLPPGRTALLLSAGAGFTWSCLVVRATSGAC